MISLKKRACVIGIGIAAAGVFAGPPVDYELVWSDEFNGIGRPDSNVWNYHVGNGYNPGLPGFQGWGNSEWEWYRPENCYQSEGNLVIRADYSTTPYYTVGGRNWYQKSGRITSRGKKSWKYGYIEAKIKLPTAPGNWCAFWMMGDSGAGDSYSKSYGPPAGYCDTMLNNWASCGEIDIMEHINNKTTGFANCFWDIRTGLFPWTAGQNADYANKEAAYGDVSQYHVYSIAWDSSFIKWQVDGVQTHVIDITPATLEEFHRPFYCIVNMALGGTLPGVEPQAADFPLYMYVDYIRVYQKRRNVANVRETKKPFSWQEPPALNPTVHLKKIDVRGRIISSPAGTTSGIRLIENSRTGSKKKVVIR